MMIETCRVSREWKSFCSFESGASRHRHGFGPFFTVNHGFSRLIGNTRNGTLLLDHLNKSSPREVNKRISSLERVDSKIDNLREEKNFLLPCNFR